MPYIRQPQPDRTMTAPIPVGVGGSGAAPAVGAPALNPLTSAPGSAQAGTGGSGAYTDFASYLNANKDQAQKLASNIINDVGSKAASAATNWSPNAPNRPAVADQNAARAAASTSLNELGSPEGVGQILADKAGTGYGNGQAQMDSYLVGSAGQGGFQALRDYYAGKLGPVTDTSTPRTVGDAPGTQHPSAAAPAHPAASAPAPAGTYDDSTRYNPGPQTGPQKPTPTYDDSTRYNPVPSTPSAPTPTYDDSNRYNRKKSSVTGGW